MWHNCRVDIFLVFLAFRLICDSLVWSPVVLGLIAIDTIWVRRRITTNLLIRDRPGFDRSFWSCLLIQCFIQSLFALSRWKQIIIILCSIIFLSAWVSLLHLRFTLYLFLNSRQIDHLYIIEPVSNNLSMWGNFLQKWTFFTPIAR